MEDVRQRLIEAAGAEFATRGFRASTVREICAKAKANVAAVNYHFGDKLHLYVETVRVASQRRAAAVPLPNWTDADPPEERLRGFVRTMVNRLLGTGVFPWEMQLMLREVLHPSEACHELAEEYFRPMFETLLNIIRQLAPQLDESRVRQVGFGIVGQCLIYRAAGEVVEMLTPANEKPFDSNDQLADHIAEFSLAAMRGLATKTTAPPVPVSQAYNSATNDM